MMAEPTLLKRCPLKNTLRYIGKKWSMSIIQDLFAGKSRFSEFLASSPEMSTKMLSTRLKDLEREKIIRKKIVSTSPVVIEYSLTERGRKLNKILYEIAVFSINDCTGEVLCDPDCKRASISALKKRLQIE
jgi:DNA-binding HxlR family transcriptional regulator